MELLPNDIELTNNPEKEIPSNDLIKFIQKFKEINVNWVISWLVGGIGIVFTIFSTMASKDAQFWLLGLYILIIAGALIYREHIFSKVIISYSNRIKTLHREKNKAIRYTSTFNCLHACAHAWRDAYCALPDGKNAVTPLLQQGVSHFAAAFSQLTGVTCRACIKVIININPKKPKNPKKTNKKNKIDPKNFHTITLCRNENTKTSEDKDKPTPLNENSDFLSLFTKKDNFFLSNDLSLTYDYRNSSWPNGHKEIEQFIKAGEYDYISTIVWPVRIGPTGGDKMVIGFLCVDSKEKNVFVKEFDVNYGATLCDLMSPVLDQYIKI